MKLVAHQGTRIFAPENSLPAYHFAGKAGFFAINFARVRASRDGTLYVMHDPTVDRTTNGTGALEEMGDAQVQCLRIDLREPYAEYQWSDFYPEELRVPTLEEGIQICLQYGCQPMIRLGISPEGHERAYTNLFRLIETYRLPGRFLLSGPLDALAFLDGFFPDTPKIFYSKRSAAEVLSLLDGVPWKNRNTVYAMLHHEMLTQETVSLLFAAGYRVYSANPNDKEHPDFARRRYAELAELGCEFANAQRSASWT